MENTKPEYLYEVQLIFIGKAQVLVIDDHSTIPVFWDPSDPRVRIIRSGRDYALMYMVEERLGLIKARIVGGNEAHGDFLAFIDAHVYVGPNWLTTPHRLLMEVPFVESCSLGSQNACKLRQLSPGPRHIHPEEGMGRHRQLGFDYRRPSPILGRRLENGRFFSDHHGDVRNEQDVVERRPTRPAAENVGRRKRGDFAAVGRAGES